MQHIKEIVSTAEKHAKNKSELESIRFELNKISVDMGDIFKALEIHSS